MYVNRIGNCKYHVQDKGNACGAAATMMLLHTIGVPYRNLLTQSDVLRQLKALTADRANWTSGPDGLTSVLNSLTSSFSFQAVARRTADEALRDVIESIQSGTPAALIFEGHHWVVAYGFQTDVEPRPGSPYGVRGVWIHNPVTNGRATSHSDADACGYGGAWGETHLLTAVGWKKQVIPCPKAGNTFVVVRVASAFDLLPPDTSWQPEPPDLSGLGPTDRAMRIAERAIRNFDLPAGLSTDNLIPEATFVVRDLDKDRPYFLTVFTIGESARVSAVIDPETSSVSSFSFDHPGESSFMPTVEEVNDALDDTLSKLPSFWGKASGWNKADASLPTQDLRLVWRRSRESSTPHLPFVEARRGGFRLYVRRGDKEVFTHLTASEKAGG